METLEENKLRERLDKENEIRYSFGSTLSQFLKRHLKDVESIEHQAKQIERKCTISSDAITDGQLFPLRYPFESYCCLSEDAKSENVIKTISNGDVIVGRIVESNDHGVIMKIFYIEHKRNVMVQHLNLMGYCGKTRYKSRHGYTHLELDCFVRGIVNSVNHFKHVIEVSFEKGDFDLPRGLQLGVISDAIQDALPRFIGSFPRDLRSFASYDNPHCVENLKERLGIDGKSLLKHNPFLKRRYRLSKGENAVSLRDKQSKIWSMNITAVGVKHFKNGEYEDAVKCFEQALQMHPKNVEALVARGALKANKFRYEDAISDFESALRIKSDHRNGQKYLVDTLISYAKQYEIDRKWSQASMAYKRALEVHPTNDIVLDRIVKLQQILAHQTITGELESHNRTSTSSASENNDEDISGRGLNYLKRLLKDEERRSTTKRKNKKKKMKQKSKTSKRKRHRKRETSSSSETEDEWIEKEIKPKTNEKKIIYERSYRDKDSYNNTKFKHLSNHDKDLMDNILKTNDN